MDKGQLKTFLGYNFSGGLFLGGKILARFYFLFGGKGGGGGGEGRG